MYEPHAYIWMILAVWCCGPLLLATVLVAWVRKKQASSRWLAIFTVCFGLFILLTVATHAYDNWRLRCELKAVNPARITKLTLSREMLCLEVSDAQIVDELTSALQSVTAVMAHHSHPTRPFYIWFESEGRRYQYRVGQDSDRPGEFWVFNELSQPDMEMGRFRAVNLERLVDALLEPGAGPARGVRTNSPPLKM